MKCPRCVIELKLSDRRGVEIDYCPQCRGVWLDRGELDKIVERSSALETRDDERDDDDEPGGGRLRGSADNGRNRKRKSWLGEMFDFGD